MLEQLLNLYPLPGEWGKPKLFQEELRLHSIVLQTVGLLCIHQNGMRVTASAAEVGPAPIERAFFELLERIYLLEAEKHSDNKTIFPKSNEEQVWNYSRSNGVAAHKTFTQACQAACLELWERHAVLDAWFMQQAPQTIENNFLHLQNIEPHYQLITKQFVTQSTNLGTIYTMGIFCLPKQAFHPLVYGFGAGYTMEMALQKTENECLQRLGFLWGEAIPDTIPNFSPTPLYHQEYFLSPPGRKALETWLLHCPTIQYKTSDNEAETFFAELTPKQLKDKFSLVKALSQQAKPLIFGQYPKINSSLCIHPIA